MTDIRDSVSPDMLARAGDRLGTVIGLLVALTATFMAVCNIKGGNITQAMGQVQAQTVDTWSYYQAKSTKQNVAEAFLTSTMLQRDTASDLPADKRAIFDERIKAYEAEVARYDREKKEIKDKAHGLEQTYDELGVRDDQLDMAEAAMTIGIAILGVTALTRKRWMLAVGCTFAGLGALFGLAAFVGWTIRLAFLGSLLG